MMRKWIIDSVALHGSNLAGPRTGQVWRGASRTGRDRLHNGEDVRPRRKRRRFRSGVFSDGAPPFNVSATARPPAAAGRSRLPTGPRSRIRLRALIPEWPQRLVRRMDDELHGGGSMTGPLRPPRWRVPRNGAFVHGVRPSTPRTDAGGGVRSVRYPNGISSRSVALVPPTDARRVHRAQALPEPVQPAASHRHREGSRLDVWAERRRHLLDGCGW